MSTIKKINLANVPTPLQKISFEGKEIIIKRDDLTGVELTGNKVRKLEYLLAEAKKEKADYIFTCGGEQSNHARATVIAASQLGFKTRLFLWGSKTNKADGNTFFYKYFNAETLYLNKKEYDNINEVMSEARTGLLKKGKNVFVIPEGGSTSTGIKGYVDFVDELQNQIDLKKAEGIVVAAGTGGTAAGIIAGLSHKKFKTKVYAVNVLYNKVEIKKKIMMLTEACILENNLGNNFDPEQLVVLDGYSNEGYKNISTDKLQLIRRFAKSTGIILDPAYTGKAFYAFYKNFSAKKDLAKNIFVHTGGIWGVMGKKEKYLST